MNKNIKDLQDKLQQAYEGGGQIRIDKQHQKRKTHSP
jgi:hypothetical protein